MKITLSLRMSLVVIVIYRPPPLKKKIFMKSSKTCAKNVVLREGGRNVHWDDRSIRKNLSQRIQGPSRMSHIHQNPDGFSVQLQTGENLNILQRTGVAHCCAVRSSGPNGREELHSTPVRHTLFSRRRGVSVPSGTAPRRSLGRAGT